MEMIPKIKMLMIYCDIVKEMNFSKQFEYGDSVI